MILLDKVNDKRKTMIMIQIIIRKNIMLNRIRSIIKYHNFFIKESPKFVGTWKEVAPPIFNLRFGYYKYSLRQKLYFPVAYFKFMFGCIKKST